MDKRVLKKKVVRFPVHFATRINIIMKKWIREDPDPKQCKEYV